MKGTAKRVVWVAVPLSVGLLAAGFLLDAKSFLVNLLATLLGIAISVAIAVTLVDRMLQERRRRQWAIVSQATLSAIRIHLIDVAIHCWVDLGGTHGKLLDPLLSGRERPDPAALRGIDGLLAVLTDLHPGTKTAHLYEEVKWDLGQIRDVLTPRVLEIADDNELMERLVALEDAERRWMNYLIADRQVVIGGTLRGVIAVLEAGRNLYETLLARAAESPG